METKAKATRSRDSRLPTARASSSVFDRLYKTQTASSKAWVAARRQNEKIRRTPVKKKKAGGADECSQIFTRLHITGTISQTSKRLYGTKHPKTPERKARTRPSLSPAKTPSARKADEFVYSPRMKPLTKLTFKSRYHPGLGLETIQPIKLGFKFFQQFCEYEHGGIDSEQIARDIIVAFFKKDFPAGSRHWNVNEPKVEKKSENVFDVSMNATYDWKCHRVASARGVVRFLASGKEVRVENYLYDVTGDLP